MTAVSRFAVLGLALLAVSWWSAELAATPQGPVVVDIWIHGNHSIPDAEILALAALAPGDPAGTPALAAVLRRLQASGRFESVEVRARYRSLSAPDRVVVLIDVVEKTPAHRKLLFFPILWGTEEEGLVYGARVGARDLLGAGEQLSVPLTWGGVRRAAFEIERDLGSTRIGGHAQVRRWENPHFEAADERTGGGVWVEQRVASRLRVRAHLDREGVEFDGVKDDLTRFGAGVTLDTRPGVIFPWGGVLLGARWQRMDPVSGDGVSRWQLRGAAYRRFLGRPILMVAGTYDGSSGPLPRYERVLVGGAGKLRGHEAGAFAGDRAAYGTVEVRVPFTDSAEFLQLGASGFWDVGAAWNAPTTISRVKFVHGAGFGVWAAPQFAVIAIDLGFDLKGGRRLHVGAGIRF